ncbi:hypothetical protein K435DRAFT_563222, partial [Dendrothele bispora CBS 962.96]
MLRRGGRGNDGERTIAETKPGELAVQCIACPLPGINLPEGWANAPDGIKFIYTMFLAFDACFRLKRKKVSSWTRDPSLQDGMAYFVEIQPYLAWVKKMQEQKEMSTCTGLSALDHANTKYHEGYDDTGKVAGLCARHEVLQKNGMGATQVGERYANVDFIVASLLRHLSVLLALLISYDIACQCSKKLVNRLKALPPFIRLNLFSLSLTSGVGQTDAESIERLWSGIGPVSTSLKEMGPGSHHDILEDHISYWNWNKITNMGALLKRRLIVAVKEYQGQFQSWVEFTKSQQHHAAEWKDMVDEYEGGLNDYNPYASPLSGGPPSLYICTYEEQVEEDFEDDLPDLETSPGEFLYFGLEIEHQQRELALDILSIKSPTNKQMTAMLDRRTKLTKQIRRFRALQLAYMPVSLHVIATLPVSQTGVNTEEIPLYLPSMLSEEQR